MKMFKKPASRIYVKDKQRRALVSAGVCIFKPKLRAKSLHSVKTIRGKFIGTR